MDPHMPKDEKLAEPSLLGSVLWDTVQSPSPASHCFREHSWPGPLRETRHLGIHTGERMASLSVSGSDALGSHSWLRTALSEKGMVCSGHPASPCFLCLPPPRGCQGNMLPAGDASRGSPSLLFSVLDGAQSYSSHYSLEENWAVWNQSILEVTKESKCELKHRSVHNAIAGTLGYI